MTREDSQLAAEPVRAPMTAISGALSIADDEQSLIRNVLADIETLQVGLGAERENNHLELARLRRAVEAEQRRGHEAEERLFAALAAARRKYKSLVDVLAQKYVQKPGKYDFRPELGAFVERRG